MAKKSCEYKMINVWEVIDRIRDGIDVKCIDMFGEDIESVVDLSVLEWSRIESDKTGRYLFYAVKEVNEVKEDA